MGKFWTILFSGINVLRNLRPLDLININEQLYKDAKINVQKLIKKKKLQPKKIMGKCWKAQGATKSP